MAACPKPLPLCHPVRPGLVVLALPMGPISITSPKLLIPSLILMMVMILLPGSVVTPLKLNEGYVVVAPPGSV